MFRAAAWTIAVCLAAAPAATRADPSRPFLVQAIQYDNTQVKLGLLAEARGQSQQVKQLGRRLKLDHFEARRRAIRLAQRMHVRFPLGADPAERAEYTRLVELSGRAFDEEFIRYALQRQQQEIAAFQAQAQSHDPAGRLAQASLARLDQDLKAAQDAQGRLGA